MFTSENPHAVLKSLSGAETEFVHAYQWLKSSEEFIVRKKDKAYVNRHLRKMLLGWGGIESVLASAETDLGEEMEQFADSHGKGNSAAYSRMVKQAIPHYEAALNHYGMFDRVLFFATDRHIRLN